MKLYNVRAWDWGTDKAAGTGMANRTRTQRGEADKLFKKTVKAMERGNHNARITLQEVTVPDRLSKADWAVYLETGDVEDLITRTILADVRTTPMGGAK